MKGRKYLCWMALAFLATALPLGASTFQQLGLEKLVRGSSVVVEGEVLNVDSFWEKEGRVIVTEATVYVTDTVYGKSGSVLKIKTFGGTVGDYTVQAPGFPTFAKGERLFLFLTPDKYEGGDMLRVTGYQQGQFRIVQSKDNVERAVSAIDMGAHLVSAEGGAKVLPSDLPLGELKDLVRREAKSMLLEHKPEN